MTRRLGSVVPVVPVIAGVGVLAWLCWHFGLTDFAAALGRLSPATLALYCLFGVAVRVGQGIRWHMVANAMGTPVPLPRLIAVRLAGDVVGSLVPSAKLAGEPLRIALLYAGGVAGAPASAGVSIDRLLEVISNMLCFIVFVAVFAWVHAFGALHRTALALILMMAGLLSVLSIPLVMLWRGVPPLAPFYGVRAQRWFVPLVRWMPALQRIESHLLQFFRDHPVTFVWGVLASLFIELLTVCEYHFLLASFAVDLDLPTLLLALVGTGVAHTVPAPGGLGALEASQVGVLALASGRPATGFVVGVVMRLHETLWMAIGLLALTWQGRVLARLRSVSPESKLVV